MLYYVHQVSSRQISSEDLFLMLMSDGVTDVLSDQHACDIALRHVAPNRLNRRQLATEASTAVVEAAFEAGSHDNITCVTLVLDPHIV